MRPTKLSIRYTSLIVLVMLEYKIKENTIKGEKTKNI